MFYSNSNVQGTPFLCNTKANPIFFKSTEFSLPMKTFSQRFGEPAKRAQISSSDFANSGDESNEDSAIQKRKRRFLSNATSSTSAKKSDNQLEPPTKRAPITFDLDKNTPQSLPTKRETIRINFNTKKLDDPTPSFTSHSSIHRSSVPTPKSNLRINYSSGESSDDDTPIKQPTSKPENSFGFRTTSTPTLPKVQNVRLVSSDKTTAEPKSATPQFLAVRQILTATKTPTRPQIQIDTPSSSTATRSLTVKRTSSTLDSQKDSSKKSRSSEASRKPITFDHKDKDEPKSEPNKDRPIFSRRPSHDDKPKTSARDSFFRSPATPQPYNSRFKNPPVYKGKDGRYYVAFFTNKYIFSNHFVCPSGVTVDDMEFPTTEHYYMYSKALFYKDENAARRIQRAGDPKEAKRITAQFENFDNDGWKKLQYKVMEKACLAKFQQNPDLRRELFRTCNAVLVEASPSDQRWGVGLNMDNPDVADDSKWRGSNLLGHLLMNVRMKLAAEYGEEFESELEEGRRDLKRRAILC